MSTTLRIDQVVSMLHFEMLQFGLHQFNVLVTLPAVQIDDTPRLTWRITDAGRQSLRRAIRSLDEEFYSRSVDEDNYVIKYPKGEGSKHILWLFTYRE